MQLTSKSLIVIAVDFGDFLDGVVARFWVDAKKRGSIDKQEQDFKDPTNSDDEFRYVAS
jgi:hypothetical protein